MAYITSLPDYRIDGDQEGSAKNNITTDSGY
jgi:hypothetical protein